MKLLQARKNAMLAQSALSTSIRHIAGWTEIVCWYSGVISRFVKMVRYGTEIDNKLRYWD